jgi:hypothetical protein
MDEEFADKSFREDGDDVLRFLFSVQTFADKEIVKGFDNSELEDLC